MHLAVPGNPFIALECLPVWNLTGDRAILHTPVLRFAAPVIERFTVKDGFGAEWQCGDQESVEQLHGVWSRLTRRLHTQQADVVKQTSFGVDRTEECCRRRNNGAAVSVSHP